MTADPLHLVVSDCRAEARDILRIELRAAQGGALPAFTPGAHLELHTPATARGPSQLRHYSLCNAPQERDRYVIAVGRVDAGRGGSVAIHQSLRHGMSLRTAAPRNNFAWTPDAARYRFIAGGIGITPLMAMIHWCQAQGREWSLLYCTRGRHHTAFYEELRALGERVRFHFDDEQPARADLAQATAHPQPGEHLYCCGPQPLMDGVAAASAGWAAGSVHFEWFPPKADAASTPDAAFEVVLRRSQERLPVPAGVSILEVLEGHGVAVPYACREGLCRTCETALCAGEAEHRDCVLSDDERAAQRSVMVCVSRARSPVLELDL